MQGISRPDSQVIRQHACDLRRAIKPVKGVRGANRRRILNLREIWKSIGSRHYPPQTDAFRRVEDFNSFETPLDGVETQLTETKAMIRRDLADPSAASTSERNSTAGMTPDADEN